MKKEPLRMFSAVTRPMRSARYWGALLALFAASLILPVYATAQQTDTAWDKVLAAARQEGKAVISGPRGQGKFKTALTETIKKKYGIEVEYSQVGPEAVIKQVREERAGGRYLWDVFVGGGNTLFSNLIPMGALEPIETALILPEVKDLKYWRGGKLPFSDPEKKSLFFLYEAGQRAFVNTNIGQPEEITTYRALLNPKWKGKILMNKDPRDKGSARTLFLFFYTHKNLGPDYVRSLLKQELIIPGDDVDALLKAGNFGFCFVNNANANLLIREKLPVKRIDPHQIEEGATITTTFANVGFADRAPHPNAAKVVINWLFSQEAGAMMSKLTGITSPRLDVSTETVDPASIPDPSWPDMDKPEIEAQVPAMLKEVVSIIGKK